MAAAAAELHLAPGEQAADVGFGGGVGLRLLLDALGGNGHVTGIDVSADMLRAAHRDFRREAATGRLTLLQGGVEDLPLPDASIDGLITVNTLYFVEDLPAAFQEIARVLTGAGRAVIGIGDPEAMRAMPFTAHGFRLRPVEEITATAETAGLTLHRHRRVGEGTRAFHLLTLQPEAGPRAVRG